MAERAISLRSDLRILLDNFTQFKNAYLALKMFCQTQEEVLDYEKKKFSKLEEEMKRLVNTSSLLEQQRKNYIDELRREKEELKTALQRLQEECNHLRRINIERVGEDAQTSKLQDELEVLKAQLALQEERHKEQIDLQAKRHSEELLEYQRRIESTSNSFNAIAKKIRAEEAQCVKHPALEDSINVEKPTRKRKTKANFRWPRLDIFKTNEDISGNKKKESHVNDGPSKVSNRKRKLYCDNSETAVDIN